MTTPTGHKILKAIIFATRAHGAQTRNYVGGPYIAHPLAVAATIERHGLPEAAIIAAILHDTVEDTSVSNEDIILEFGHDVASIVRELTDVDKDDLFIVDGTQVKMNRAVRKAMDRDRLSAASSYGQSIKLADMIDNTASIVQYDPDFAVKYLEEMFAMLDVLTRGDSALMTLARQSHAAATSKLGNYIVNFLPTKYG